MKNFQNITENIHLSPKQKNTMWSTIVHKIELSEKSLQENVRMNDDKRHTQGGAYTKPSSLSPKKKYMNNNAKIFATMIFIIGAIMATAAFAAEQALPGDALYDFKVHVNESVRGALSFTVENKAKWEIEKIERRAEEKRELEAQSHMTVAANAEIESQYQDSAEKVRAVILRLQTEGKAEAATSLEGGLNTAINAIVAANTRRSNSSSDVDISNDIGVEVDSDTEINDSRDGIVEVEGDVQGNIRSDTKGENKSGSSSLKSDLDIQEEFEVLTED